MKRTAASLVVAVLLFGACSSTNETADRAFDPEGKYAETQTDATTAKPDASAKAPSSDPVAAGPTGSTIGTTTVDEPIQGGGGTKSVSGPIKIGIVRTGVSNAEAYGVSFGETVTEAKVYDALIKAFNDSGGIAGRKIIPIYADTDTASSSWDADFAAACAKFTEDHTVAAVLGYVFNFDPAFETCLARKGIPHLSTTFNVPDSVELAKYPLLVNLGTPRIERRSRTKIDGAMKTGVLTKVSKLGIVIDSCPGTKRAWLDKTKPYLEAKGLNIASVYESGCPHGSSEAGTEIGRAGNLVLQFRTAGVDRVMINSVSEGPPVFVIASAAEAQNWYPKYVVSSLANAAVLASQMSPRQAENVHGYGWLPVQDVNPAQWPGQTAPQKRCTAMASRNGVKLQSATDYSYAFNLCDALFAYERALKATRGAAAGQGIVGAVETFGTSYVSAMTLEGRARLTPSVHDAPTLARYFAWDDGCSCYTYRSTKLAIP